MNLDRTETGANNVSRVLDHATIPRAEGVQPSVECDALLDANLSTTAFGSQAAWANIDRPRAMSETRAFILGDTPLEDKWTPVSLRLCSVQTDIVAKEKEKCALYGLPGIDDTEAECNASDVNTLQAMDDEWDRVY